jgi:hypothetical protein
MAEPIDFSVKCPSRPALGDFKLRVPASATVGEVKHRLQQSYPGNPEPASITVSPGPCSTAHPHLWHLTGGAGGSSAGWPLLRPVATALRCSSLPATCPLLSPLGLQAIYAGRVLKDDSAVLSDFVVPVSLLTPFVCAAWLPFLAHRPFGCSFVCSSI